MDKSVDITQRCVYLSLQPYDRQASPTGDNAYAPGKGEYYNEHINTTNHRRHTGVCNRKRQYNKTVAVIIHVPRLLFFACCTHTHTHTHHTAVV